MANLAYGSSGSDVRKLQQELKKAGYNIAADGVFGAETQAAVEAYQRANGLGVDGIAGNRTLGSLGITSATPDPTKTSYYTGNSGKYQLGDNVGYDVAVANPAKNTGSGGGSSNFYNGGLSDAQIREMQNYYGAAADGLWGQNSTAAAGGLNAQQAWQQYQQETGAGGTNAGGWYNNGGLTTDQIIAMQQYYGTPADGKWGQNSTAAAGGLNAQQAWQQYQQETGAGGIMGFGEFYNSMGGADFEKMLRENINASVQRAVNSYEAQKQETEKDAQEMARQAYVAKMLGEKNMAQRLAAGGYAGGMAESAMLESETNYQNNLAEIQRQRQRALDEIQRAIDNARLTGDMEMAEQMTAYMAQVQSYYSDYYDQMLSQQMQMQQAQAQMGGTSGGAGYTSGGSYASNGGVSPTTVMMLQQQINSTLPAGQQIAVDGVWGPATTAATGGMSASQYLDAYENYMTRNSYRGPR